jgi:5-deoxy-glucuronate isomerase
MNLNETSYFEMIRNYRNNNQPVLSVNNHVLPNSYFNLIRLNKGDTFNQQINGFEFVWVVLQGNVDFTVDGIKYSNVGIRKDIWSGTADSVYVGNGSQVEVVSNTSGTEIAVAGGICMKIYESFRIPPDEVEMVEVGSVETHSRRRIFHILGHNGIGRAGNLLVSELYCEEGCWSGYPPHKHDMENPPEETEFEEIYHFRYNPNTGFGAQFCYQDSGDSQCFMICDGDTFAFRKGYHPTVASPGHQGYIFTILVGVHQRSLIQNFKREHRHLMSKIPGINDMRSKFIMKALFYYFLLC